MATEQLNARDLILEVSDGAGTPVWTQVGGITEVAINYGENEETEDTTTFDSGGNYEQEIMQRGRSLNIKGKALVDTVTGAREPGQLQLNEYAELTGTASKVPIRMRYPLDTEWITWSATVTRGSEGGGTNNKTGFEYTLTRSGASGTAPVA